MKRYENFLQVASTKGIEHWQYGTQTKRIVINVVSVFIFSHWLLLYAMLAGYIKCDLPGITHFEKLHI